MPFTYQTLMGGLPGGFAPAEQLEAQTICLYPTRFCQYPTNFCRPPSFVACGHYTPPIPPTCSPNTKIPRTGCPAGSLIPPTTTTYLQMTPEILEHGVREVLADTLADASELTALRGQLKALIGKVERAEAEIIRRQAPESIEQAEALEAALVERLNALRGQMEQMKQS